MLVVCDTSPISALLTVGKAGLLADLFGEVVIPPGVAEELLRFHPSIPPWLRVIPVSDTKKVTHIAELLDRGESEAIVLAMEIGADLVLIDEKAGRGLAAQFLFCKSYELNLG